MPALKPGQVLLSDIRFQVRSRTDRLKRNAPLVAYPDPYANSFTTTKELNLFVNAAYKELYTLLVRQYSNYWYTSKAIIQTDGANEQFLLPFDCLKHLSTEWVLSPSLSTVNGVVVNSNNTNNITLKRFNVNERNFYSNQAYASPLSQQSTIRYSVFGDTIWFKPLPSGGVYQILYVPIPTPLADEGAITMNGVVAGKVLTINDVVFAAIAYGGTPTGNQFVVGGTGASNLGDAGTATSLATALNASSLGGLAGILTATATTGVPPTVHVVLTAPATVTWSTTDSTMLLDPSQVSGPIGATITWSNIMGAYSGLEEYLVVDAAIRLLQKEESLETAATFEQQKLALKKRYDGDYTNRDAGSPKTSTITRGPFGGWGNGGAGWGGL